MTELRIDRFVAADPARVWRAFTDPQRLAAWFWPASWQTVVELDPVVGGRFSIASSVSGVSLTGEITAIDEPVLLAFTWRWEGEAGTTAVSIELAPVDECTRVTVTHERFADEASRDQHLQGWSDCLDRLPAAVAD